MLADSLINLSGDGFITSRFLLAGMPSVSLTDAVRLRLETISFFGFGVLLSAGVVCWLWNGLRRDFERLPRLSYRAALCGTVLWGLLFILVLTMISGARELLSPGAWEKNGPTYRLKDADDPTAAETDLAPAGAQNVTLVERVRSLEDLRSVLMVYASQHDGGFPDDPQGTRTLPVVWTHPGFALAPYGYVPGRTAGDSRSVVAFEFALYGDNTQLALFTDGQISELTDNDRDQLAAELRSGTGPSPESDE